MRFVAFVILLVAPTVLALPVPVVPLPHATPVLAPRMITEIGMKDYSLGLTSQGETVISDGRLVTKFSQQGNALWTVSTGWDAGVVTVDDNDNVLIGAPTIKAYTSQGVLLWQRLLTPTTIVRGIATDAAGNIYLAAYADGVNAGEAWKLSKAGVVQWRTVLAPTLDGANGIAVTPDGQRITVVSDQTTKGLNAAGQILWTTALPSFHVIMDTEGNAYAGRQVDFNALGQPIGYLAKLSPTGQVLWNHADAGLYVALIGDRIIAVNHIVAGQFLPSPLPGLAGFTIDAYDTATGTWQYGFQHISRTWTGALYSFGGNVVTTPGYLAFGADGYDTAVYDAAWILNACIATPFMSTPRTARVCAFVDV